MLIGIAGNVMKQNAIIPPPRDASMATEEEAGRAGRNFIRGALLGIGATVLGVLLGGAPDYLAGTIKLPAVLTEPGLLVSSHNCLQNQANSKPNWGLFRVLRLFTH
jgi:hypothetical protein